MFDTSIPVSNKYS